ncbi:MAG: hypothetical protein M1820_002103 [Bogoriella megaspora]|nr:MAG: hypothetical protein M1820_002103 [Bogoriella megaspora]
MPRVISYTPAWLSRPAPGFDLFNAPTKTQAPTTSSPNEYRGPNKTLARRGREVFTVVGNELRWADLGHLKDEWEEQAHITKSQSRSKYGGQSLPVGANQNSSDSARYKVLKVPVHNQIRQLVVSPREDYLAIITSHTIHVALIPDSSHLTASETPVIKPRTFQLGPTAHVLEQSPIASVLWHPLGVRGSCLVTIAKDATVRLWELSRENRYSFDEPTLAVDLKKLANATSYEADFKASKYGTNKTFSPDNVEMEVAAACFGGSGGNDEHGWSSMTLWVAMTEGDIYALCPLLPTKWQPTSTLIPSLSTSVVTKTAAMKSDSNSTEKDRISTEQQYQWFQDIDEQIPLGLNDEEFFEAKEVYTRPTCLGPIPRLQGPFAIDPDVDMFGEIADLYVVAAKPDDDNLMFDEELEDNEQYEGLPVAVICLLMSSGLVHVCLDLDGVEGQWLPLNQPSHSVQSEELLPSLLLVEKVQLFSASDPANQSCPTFSPDAHSRHALLVTHDTGVYYLSFSSWITWLDNEFRAASAPGSSFRLDVLLETLKTLVERPITISPDQRQDFRPSGTSAVLSMKDPNLGYFALTTSNGHPYAASLDISDADLFLEAASTSLYQPFAPTQSVDRALAINTAPESRAPYQPSDVFWEPSSFSDSLKKTVPQRDQDLLKDEVKLSPATLELLNQAHAVLGKKTLELNNAAGDLFTRSDRLVTEMSSQIRRVIMMQEQLEKVIGADQEAEQTTSELMEKKLHRIRNRQEELGQRHDALRRKLEGFGGRPIGLKEQAWQAEVDGIQDSVDIAKTRQDDEDAPASEDRSLMGRYEEVKKLADELIRQGHEASEDLGQQNGDTANGEEVSRDDPNIKVPPSLQKAKVAEVEAMLERESELVEATTEKLTRLRMQALSTSDLF